MLSANLSPSFASPLHIVRGSGAFLFAADGTAYLDCVNNVCHVGHSHPRVVAAGAAQAAVLNTNSATFQTLAQQARQARGADFSVCDIELPVRVTPAA